MCPRVWLHGRMAAAEKMEPYKFRERPSYMRRVQAVADHRGDNVSELIRNALRDYLRAYEQELPRDAQPATVQASETDEES